MQIKFCINYYKGNCDYTNLLLVCKIKNKYIDNINIKFYYYYLLSIKDILTKTFLKGTANLSLDTKNFNRMKIPIPPIHIQDKITQKIDSSNEKVKYMKLIVESMKQDVINFFETNKLDKCKSFACMGCSEISNLPSLPNCVYLNCSNLTKLQTLPKLENCKRISLTRLCISELPELPKCETLELNHMKELTCLPALPNCNTLVLDNCPKLKYKKYMKELFKPNAWEYITNNCQLDESVEQKGGKMYKINY